MFEFTDDDQSDLDIKVSPSKKPLKCPKVSICSNQTNTLYLKLKKKKDQVLSKSVNSSPIGATGTKQTGTARKLILNRSLNHLMDMGSNCEGSNNSCSGLSSNSNPNSNQSFNFEDNYEYSAGLKAIENN